MNEVPEIMTPRCVLASISEEDYSALSEIFNDVQTRKFLPEIYEMIDGADGVLRFVTAFEHYLSIDQGILWGVFASGQLVGLVAIMDMLDNPSIFYAMHHSYRSRGYMKEALACVVDFIKSNHPCSVISTEVYKSNESSLHLLTKLGFVIDREDGDKIYMQIYVANDRFAI